MYYYKRTEFSPHCLYTVGHDENGKWIPESDHEDIHSASRRVNFLNGGVEETIESDELATLRAENAQLREALEGILRVVNVRIDDPRVAQFDTARAALNSGIIFSPNP